MNNQLQTLISSLEECVPYFDTTHLPSSHPPMDEDIWYEWLYEAMKEKFLVYIEWKEWDWEIETINNLIAIKKVGVEIDYDKVMEQLSQDIDLEAEGEDAWELSYSIGESILSCINQELKPHNLMFVDVGVNENPYLLCTTNDTDKLDKLSIAFHAFGIDMIC